MVSKVVRSNGSVRTQMLAALQLGTHGAQRIPHLSKSYFSHLYNGIMNSTYFIVLFILF